MNVVLKYAAKISGKIRKERKIFQEKFINLFARKSEKFNWSNDEDERE